MDTENQINQAVAQQLLSELKSQRKSGWIRFSIKVLLVLIVAGALMSTGNNFQGQGNENSNKNEPHIAFIELYGPIMTGGLADADRVVPALQKAFDDPKAEVVVLRINSPGGSPVQASRLYKEINTLKTKHDKPIYAVVEDLAASAAYYAASATDGIYVDQSSMIGSIGVISASFGFEKLMDTVGIERRVYTAGKNKSFLDPYSPVKPETIERWEGMLLEVHGQFIKAVKDGRGDKLNAETEGLFSGLMWSGESSIKIGLADDLKSLADISREKLGKINTVNYTPKPDFLKTLSREARIQAQALLIAEPQLN